MKRKDDCSKRRRKKPNKKVDPDHEHNDGSADRPPTLEQGAHDKEEEWCQKPTYAEAQPYSIRELAQY